MAKKIGDRKDGKLLRDLDSMHFICPIIYPNRCDNEAFISERIDLTNLDHFLAEKNTEGIDYKYNLFQCIVTAILKTLYLRPKMNRFIANRNTYQRNEISASFVIKKQFADHGAEALAFIHSKPEDNLDSIHESIRRKVTEGRSDKIDASTESMDIVNRLPRFLSKTIVRFICFLDRHGWVPDSMIATDPYYSSVVLSNLGSIKLHSGYHHLTNWGTNSLFIAIGEIRKRPFYNEDGTISMKNSVDIGITVDERIADGYYYSKTVRLFRTLLEHPELLETSLEQKVDY